MPDVKLIDLELWEPAQNQRVKNKVFSKRNRKLEYLLSGFLRCSCGLKMYSQSMQGGRYLYYHCGGRSYKKHLLKCNSKYVRAFLADALAWRWIKNLLLDDEQLEVGLKMYAERRKDEIKPMHERLATIEGLIMSNERKLNNLTDELS